LESLDLYDFLAGDGWHRGCTFSPVMSARRHFPKVLLVSNDRGLWRQLRNCLSDLGVATSSLMTVKNGHGGLTALTSIRPCLVVLDDGIPDVAAHELLRTLHQRNPQVLVVYLATHHTPELERAIRQLGVLYYTEKPPDSLLLEKVLRTVFASTGRIRNDRGMSCHGERVVCQR
jgi:DNA-binding NtrC family response regulator